MTPKTQDTSSQQVIDMRQKGGDQAFLAIFDAAHFAIVLMKPEGEILTINRVGAELLGALPEDLVGRNQFELMPEKAATALRLRAGEALSGGTPIVFEDERDGKIFRTNVSPVFEACPHLVVYSEDITAQRVAEKSAREADRQFAELVNLASEGIVTLDLEGRIVFANPGFHVLLGASSGELQGKLIQTFVAEVGGMDFLALVERMRLSERREPQRVSCCLRRLSGEEFLALISVVMNATADGVAGSLVAVITDISELQRAEVALAESERRLEVALAGAAESIWQWNLDTGEAYWSPEFYRQLGYPDLAFPGSTEEWLVHMHPDDRQATMQAIQNQLSAGQEILDVTYRFRNKSGQWRWIRGRGKIARKAEDGHPVLLSGTNLDVTDQYLERVQQQLQTDRWRALLELAQIGNFEEVSDESSFLRQALDEALRLTGSRIGFFYQVHDDQKTCELIASSGESGRSAMDSGGNTCLLDSAGLWAACAREHRGLIFNDCASAGGSSSVQVVSGEPARLMGVPLIRDELVRAIVWVGDKIAPYDQDDLEFLQILAADTWRIVQKRRADIELHDALRVVEASPVVSFRWRAEPGWPVDYVSKNVSRWGWSASDLMAGKPAFIDLVHPDDLAKVAEEVMQHTAAGDVEYGQEYRLRATDGHYFWVEDSTRVLRDEAGIVRFYEGVVTDVDADKCREHDLAASLEAQRALNQKLESAQSQLLQSEKMASIGQLAAGVAHEINNPIGFVNSNFGTLSTYLRELFEILDICEASAATAANPADFEMMHAAKAARDFDYLRQDIGQLIDESKDGLERVRKIVQDLKDFSRVGEVEWQWADINHGLDATLNIVWNELKYHCTVNRQFGSLPRIYCLPSQLNQVFMNLLVNAGQAIEGKGEITITTECLGTDTVQIRIQDTGRGIPPENINRIFDPFFTTKPVGKGTGLGLSLAWSIVKRHGGRIEVASILNQGTTFTVTLPVKPAESETKGATS